MLVAGAELFAEHAATAGLRLGVSALAVGVLLAGAEPEELITAVTAASRDPRHRGGRPHRGQRNHVDLALGMAAVLRPLPLGGRVRVYAIGATLAGVVAAAVVIDGDVSRVEGLGLVGAYAVLVGFVWRRERQPPVIGELAEVLEPDDDDHRNQRTVLGLWLALAGIVVMAVGGVIAVRGAERVVDALSISDTAVGLTWPAPGQPANQTTGSGCRPGPVARNTTTRIGSWRSPPPDRVLGDHQHVHSDSP